jgi:hypothetical protein
VDLGAFMANPPGGYWLSEPDHFVAQFQGTVPGGHDLDLITEKLSAENLLGRQGRTANWLTLGLSLDAERFVNRVQRSGCLRASRSGFNVAPARAAVEAVLGAQDALKLPRGVADYLAYASRLLSVAGDVASLRNHLVCELRNQRGVAVRSLLATVDMLFDPHAVQLPNRTLPTDDWHHHSREDLAEAASFCLYLSNEEVGIRSDDFTLLDERGVPEGRWMLLLVQAAKIRKFLEWEVLVDSGVFAVEQCTGPCARRLRGGHPAGPLLG